MKKIIIKLLICLLPVVITAQINVNQYGIVSGGLKNDSLFAKIKKAKGKYYFPTGNYLFKNGIQVYADSIEIYGDGPGKTIINTPDNSDATGLEISQYRSIGWTLNVIPFKNEVYSGQKYVVLKDIANAISFKPRTKIFINGGASGYDQNYGEFNIVERVSRDTVFLLYTIVKDLNYENSSWFGSLGSDFTIPYGKTAIATINNPPAVTIFPYASINNSTFKILSVSGNSVTLQNNIKTNDTAFITGAKVFKARNIYLTPLSSSGVNVHDLTIVGHRKAVSISNSIGMRFTNVEFIWKPGKSKGGLVIDGDDGRDAVFDKCYLHADSLQDCQIARSFTGLKLLDCKLDQVAVNFSEFSSNCEIRNCEIYCKAQPYRYYIPIQIGWTTTNILLDGNTVTIDGGIYCAISSFSDVNTYTASLGGQVIIQNNLIQCNGSTLAFNMYGPGMMTLQNNHVTGRTEGVFAANGLVLNNAGTYAFKSNLERAVKGSLVRYLNNTFAGYCDMFYRTRPTNIICEGNYTDRFGPYDPLNREVGFGNILYNHGNGIDYTPVEIVRFKNNIFKNWEYLDYSFNYDNTLSEKVDISNNLFLNSRKNWVYTPQFIINTYPK